jgi:hypothetical protein
MKGGVSVGSTAFNNSGQATYAVHETGIYTLTCDGYTGSATVTEETTYPVSILAGLDLASWISAGSTTEHPLNPSSYADFAALEADEEAIRQLMTVHASVDYLAQATAGDSLMESVIGSDVCAKWINLRDYALDTLYANSDIASEMDSADKYFYGEWVENSGTWGAKGNVPIMTSNTAPYGVASAYQVFDGSASTSASGTDFSYQSVNPICVKKFECSVNGGTLQGSNDGSTYTDISDPSSNTTYYMYHKVHFASSQTVHTLQFYGKELPVKQASAPTDGREYVQIGSDYYTEDWGEKEFAPSSGMKYIYDHGVELVELEEFSTANGWSTGNSYTFADNSFDKLSDALYIHNASNYKLAGGGTKETVAINIGNTLHTMYVIGIPTSSVTFALDIAIVSNKTWSSTAGYVLLGTGQREISLDISSYNGNYNIAIGADSNASRYGYIEEIWLE